MPQTITYRGPTVLAGAFAHLLREEGVAFDRPREDRTGVAEAVVVVIEVSTGDGAPDRLLGDRVDAAVERFTKRFGADAAAIDVVDGAGED